MSDTRCSIDWADHRWLALVARAGHYGRRRPAICRWRLLDAPEFKMKATLRYIRDAGDIENERVVIRVDATANIGHYLLGDTDFQEDGTVVASLRAVYWFPDTTVSAGDFVILYTKAGVARRGANRA